MISVTPRESLLAEPRLRRLFISISADGNCRRIRERHAARRDTALLGMLFGFLFVQLRRHTQLNIMKVLRGGRFAMNCSKGTPRYRAEIVVGPLTLLSTARGGQRLRLPREKGARRGRAPCLYLASAASGSRIWLRLSRMATPRRQVALLRRTVVCWSFFRRGGKFCELPL